MQVPLSNSGTQSTTGYGAVSGSNASGVSVLIDPKSTLSKVEAELMGVRKRPHRHKDDEEGDDDELVRTGSATERDATSHKTTHHPSPLLSMGNRNLNKQISLARYNSDDETQGQGSACGNFLNQLPAVLMLSLMNLQEGVPYGLLFFPATFGKYRVIGVSMFFISCFIGQVFTACGSSLKCGVIQPVLQNIPFVSALAASICANGFSAEHLPTILFLINLCTISTAAGGFLLGHFNLGTLVSYLPLSFLRAVLGGLGLFLLQTGIEASASVTWEWSSSFFQHVFEVQKVELWGVMIGSWLMAQVLLLVLPGEAEGILACLKNKPDKGRAAPHPAWEHVRMNFDLIFFLASFGSFYLVALLCVGASMDQLWANEWLLPQVAGLEWWTIYEYAFKYDQIDWDVVKGSLGHVAAITFFSVLMAVIGIGGLADLPGAITPGHVYRINNELRLGAASNALSAVSCNWMHFITIGNSQMFMKLAPVVDGFGSLAVALCSLGLVLLGPEPTCYIPRCVAGFVPWNLGMILSTRYLGYTVYKSTPLLEYINMWLISLLMVLWGFLEGLAVGLVCAFFITIYDLSRTNTGVLIEDAMQFESSDITTHNQAERHTLLSLKGHIALIRPYGIIFFGSVQKFQAWFDTLAARPEVDCVILDLRHVTYVDSSGMGFLQALRKQALRRHILLLLCDGDGNGREGFDSSEYDDPLAENDSPEAKLCLLNGVAEAARAVSDEELINLQARWAKHQVKDAVQAVRARYVQPNEGHARLLACAKLDEVVQAEQRDMPLHLPTLDQALAHAEHFLLELHTAGAFG